jgi:hypothetical protein
MAGPGVPEPDMPKFYRLHADAPGLPGEALDAMLAGVPVTAGAVTGSPSSPDLPRAAELLRALTAAPAADELAGYATALAEFRRLPTRRLPAGPATRRLPAGAGAGRLPGSPPVPPRSARTARSGRLRLGLTARLAGGLAGAAVAFGGAAAAAYAGMLPAPMQRLAHDLIGAPGPAARPPRTPAPAPAGVGGSPGSRSGASAASDSAAGVPSGLAGLCSAWAGASPAGRAHSAEFTQLIAAVGGPGKVTAYCAAAAGSPSAAVTASAGTSAGASSAAAKHPPHPTPAPHTTRPHPGPPHPSHTP